MALANSPMASMAKNSDIKPGGQTHLSNMTQPSNIK